MKDSINGDDVCQGDDDSESVIIAVGADICAGKNFAEKRARFFWNKTKTRAADAWCKQVLRRCAIL